jgi:hypothetical protein
MGSGVPIASGTDIYPPLPERPPKNTYILYTYKYPKGGPKGECSGSLEGYPLLLLPWGRTQGKGIDEGTPQGITNGEPEGDPKCFGSRI